MKKKNKNTFKFCASRGLNEVCVLVFNTAVVGGGDETFIDQQNLALLVLLLTTMKLIFIQIFITNSMSHNS